MASDQPQRVQSVDRRQHGIESGNAHLREHDAAKSLAQPFGACRQRPEDVAPLVRHFLERFVPDVSARPVLSPSALGALLRRGWPGNVRELKNVLVRAAALAQDGIIHRADVIGEGESQKSAPNIDFLSKFSDAKEKSIERFERAYLEALMRRTGGNLSKASREADIARHHLRDLLKKRGLYNMSFGEPE